MLAAVAGTDQLPHAEAKGLSLNANNRTQRVRNQRDRLVMPSYDAFDDYRDHRQKSRQIIQTASPCKE